MVAATTTDNGSLSASTLPCSHHSCCAILHCSGLKASLSDLDNRAISSERGAEIPTRMDSYSIDGTYSVVYTSPHRDIALKTLRCVSTDHAYISKVVSMYENVLRPVWALLSHEHISPLLDIRTNDNLPPTLVVPFYKEGHIMDYNKRCSDADKLNQIKQFATAISYLHGQNVSHGNICPANVLIKDDGGVCISDPLVNVLMRELTYDTYAPTPVTWCYKPREELLNAIPMGPKADVYAWASVVYEVYCGKQPYHGYPYCRGIVKIINHGHRALEKPPEICPKLWSIMQKCWVPHPAGRPTMDQVELDLQGL